MTRREAAIVSAYTGILLGDYADLQAYAEQVLHRPIWTHQLGDAALAERLKDAARADFVAIPVTP